VSTTDGNLLSLDCASGNTKSIVSLRNVKTVYQIVELSDGSLLSVTDRGLFVDAQAQNHLGSVYGEATSVSAHPIMPCVALLSNGRVVVYTLNTNTHLLEEISQRDGLEMNNPSYARVFMDDSEGLWILETNSSSNLWFKLFQHVEGRLTDPTPKKFELLGSIILHMTCVDQLVVIISATHDFGRFYAFLYDSKENKSYYYSLQCSGGQYQQVVFHDFLVLHVVRQGTDIDLNILGLKDRGEMVVFTFESHTSHELLQYVNRLKSLDFFPRLDYLLEHQLAAIICSAINENRKRPNLPSYDNRAQKGSVLGESLNEMHVFQWLCQKVRMLKEEAVSTYEPLIDEEHPEARRLLDQYEKEEMQTRLTNCSSQLYSLLTIFDTLAPTEQLCRSFEVDRADIERFAFVLDILALWLADGLLPLPRLGTPHTLVGVSRHVASTHHDEYIQSILRTIVPKQNDQFSFISFCTQTIGLKNNVTILEVIKHIVSKKDIPIDHVHMILFYFMTNLPESNESNTSLEHYAKRFQLSEKFQRFVIGACSFDRGQVKESYHFLIQSGLNKLNEMKNGETLIRDLVYWYIYNGYYNFAIDVIRAYNCDKRESTFSSLSFVADLGLCPDSMHLVFLHCRQLQDNEKYFKIMLGYCQMKNMLTEFFSLPFSEHEVEIIKKTVKTEQLFLFWIIQGKMEKAIQMRDSPISSKLTPVVESVSQLVPDIPRPSKKRLELR